MTTQNEQTTQHGNAAKHTPTPWKTSPSGLSVLSAQGHDIAQCFGSPITYASGHANAAFIVRACNSHAALLEALEKVYANAAESPEWIRAVLAPAISKARGGAL